MEPAVITFLDLVDFKNFAKERVRMGPFTVIAGANASGKSNIRDALRFLHGVGRGYTLADILGGKYGPGGEVQWDGIRGAPREVVRAGDVDRFQLFLGTSEGLYDVAEELYGIGVTIDGTKPPSLHAEILLSVHGTRLQKMKRTDGVEETRKKLTVYFSHPPAPDPVHRQDDPGHLLLRMGKSPSQKKYGYRVSVRNNQPALTQIEEHRHIRRSHKDSVRSVIQTLSRMRFLDPSPERMRQPSFPGQITLGDRGDNLPTVLKEICEDPTRRQALIEWTRELTPMDVKDFQFNSDPITGQIQLAFLEANNRRISAYSASDGTLRFLAILAALLGKDSAGFYVFEEIDNGIHPSRLRLLLDLIESQTADGKKQVITTTHSPELLSMVSDQVFENTAVVCRRPGTDDAVIRQAADLPNIEKLRKSQGLGRLHASGWMEDAIFFGDDDEQATTE